MSDTLPSRLHHLFERRLALAPDEEFILTPEAVVTPRMLEGMVGVLEQELREAGVQPGDRVMIAAENCPQHVALILACSRVGAWSCGVNARMSRGELQAFVDKADPRLVYFTSAVSDAAAAHARDAQATPSALAGLSRGAPRPEAVAQAEPLASEVAAIIFTSGTTGQPKGVLVSHAGLVQFARASTDMRDLSDADRAYAYLPMTHIFGLGSVLAASLHSGARLVMRSRFDPADVFDALAHQRVSILQGPPAMYTRLLAWLDEQGIARPEAPLLRYLYTGAAPLDINLKRAVEARFGQPLHHGYGLSEYAGALTMVRLGEQRDDCSTGYLVEGAQLQIVDADGRVLPDGERGEIWMRGVGRFPGYFRDPEITAQVIKPGGWYASGDVGYVDAGGSLHVVGRLKEMIIRSGFNVYPGEVESVLCAFPGVRRAAVVGRPLSDGNEEILAFLETEGGVMPERGALDAFLADRLAPYKRPGVVRAMEAFPMTLSGKILKRELMSMG